MTDEKPSLITDATAAAERLEKANVEMRTNIARLEELETRRILGGKADAGKPEEKPKEIDPKTYAQEALAGRIPVVNK